MGALILSALWRPILALLAGLGAYAKGRSDAARKAELDAWRQAHEAEKQRTAIDRSGDPDGARSRLRERARRG